MPHRQREANAPARSNPEPARVVAAALLADLPAADPLVDRDRGDRRDSGHEGCGADQHSPDHRDRARHRPHGSARHFADDLGVSECRQRPRRSGGAARSRGKRPGMSDLERVPILRVMPGPGDINANGHIFGGWVLSQMDIAAGIVASRRAKGPVATVAIEAMAFLAPIHLRDLISVYAEVERVGRTSMAVRIEVVAERDLGATEVKVTEGVFTFVALDADHRPRAVDQASSTIV